MPKLREEFYQWQREVNRWEGMVEGMDSLMLCIQGMNKSIPWELYVVRDVLFEKAKLIKRCRPS